MDLFDAVRVGGRGVRLQWVVVDEGIQFSFERVTVEKGLNSFLECFNFEGFESMRDFIVQPS